MTLVELGLVIVLLGAGLGLAAAGVTSARFRGVASGLLTCGIGVGGLMAGVGALGGEAFSFTARHLLPLSEATLAVDPLSGLFMCLVGGVAVAAGLYSIGDTNAASRDVPGPQPGPAGGDDADRDCGVRVVGAASRTTQVVLPVFAATMILVPAAANVTTFLVFWELMALASLVLVLAEHRLRPKVLEAGVWYAAMTHVGLVAILLGLVTFAGSAEGESFAAMRDAAAGISPTVKSVIFLLVFFGFASKLGIVPMHVWLTRADPEAPSHVSALMSAALVKLGLYGLLRVGFDLLGGGPRWWWILVLAVGALSALYGVLQASVSTDLRVLLSYSTIENTGLILMGVGSAGMFAADGDRTLASLLMIAALLHAVNHAGFKSLLFLCSGSVLRATGHRDLDRLGGLVSRMPATTALMGVGALGASGLPPGNGFVSEWLLLQGLIHSLSGAGSPDVVVAVSMPLAVAVVALTAGLGVVTFVKAFGVGFLARPRSAEAAAAVEGPASMRLGMGVVAAACVALAMAPTLVTQPLVHVLATMPSVRGGAPVTSGVILELSGITGSLSPLLIAVGLVAGVTVLVGLTGWGGRRRPRRKALVWGGGGSRLSPRMEYTATSFAEPLTRVFDDILRPEHDIDVTHYRESRYLVESVRFRQRVPDRLEARLYPPLLSWVRRWGDLARRAQSGSVHRYLAYGLVGLIGVLIFVAVTS